MLLPEIGYGEDAGQGREMVSIADLQGGVGQVRVAVDAARRMTDGLSVAGQDIHIPGLDTPFGQSLHHQGSMQPRDPGVGDGQVFDPHPLLHREGSHVGYVFGCVRHALESHQAWCRGRSGTMEGAQGDIESVDGRAGHESQDGADGPVRNPHQVLYICPHTQR